MLRHRLRQILTGLLFLLSMQFTCHAWALNWEQSAILGSDKDADGVRDDVAVFINQQWQAQDLRHWAQEAARASQAYLGSGGNRFALHRAHAFMERSRRCLSQTHSPQLANTVINHVLRVQLDSYERKQRYKEAVDQWVHKVSREDLPAHPDDNWNPACGPADTPAAQVANIPRPQASTDSENLPPPNFFITRAMPRTAPDQAAVKFLPLPGTEETAAASAPAEPTPSRDVVTTPRVGSWSMYTPRKNTGQNYVKHNDASPLPVRKLKAGESARLATRKTLAAEPSQRQSIRPRPDPVTHKRRLPAALDELAPFIEAVQQR